MDLKSKTNYINCCKQNDNCLSSSHNYNNKNQNQLCSNGNSSVTATAATGSLSLSSSSSSLSSTSTIASSSSLNKRKRSYVENKDNEYEHPAKRMLHNNSTESLSQTNSLSSSTSSSSTSSSSSSSNYAQMMNYLTTDHNEVVSTTNSETRSSSDCLSTVADYNIDTPCSSSSRDNGELNDDTNNVSPSSPTSSNSNTSNSNLDNQQERGEKTPHVSKIKYGNDDSYDDDYSSSSSSSSIMCDTPVSDMPMCPLPALSWANASDVWNLMCQNDEIASYDRNPSMLENHPGLQPRMRAILLDWLIEVCEVYKLHRETYYLAVDYIDRYLTVTKNVQKTHLQLIGITCLFIAAKVEEIYPPKLSEFAYVTDGACQEEDILQHELLILKALDWDVSPLTIMAWLGVYMQLNVTNRTPECFSEINASTLNKPIALNKLDEIVDSKENNNNINQQQEQCQRKITNCTEYEYSGDKTNLNFNIISSSGSFPCDASCSKSTNTSTKTSANNNNLNLNKTSLPLFTKTEDDSGVSMAIQNLNNTNDDAFIYPQFSGLEYVQTSQLLDLCSLDVKISNFRYSVIAAAAISHTFSRETALRVSGFDWDTIAPCAKWMEPFFSVIYEESQHIFLLENNEQINTKFGLGHICPNIVTDDSHIIQTHTTSVEMFDKVVLKLEQHNKPIKQEASPAVGFVCHQGLLTPPASDRKPLDETNDNEICLHPQ